MSIKHFRFLLIDKKWIPWICLELRNNEWMNEWMVRIYWIESHQLNIVYFREFVGTCFLLDEISKTIWFCHFVAFSFISLIYCAETSAIIIKANKYRMIKWYHFYLFISKYFILIVLWSVVVLNRVQIW